MKKVIAFLAEGFEEVEALTVVDYLRRAEIEVSTVSLTEDYFVTGSHDIMVKTDKLMENLDYKEYDAIYLPGGIPGSVNLRDDSRVLEIIKDFDSKGKIISAICAAPIVLQEADVLNGKTFTSYPSFEEHFDKELNYSEKGLVDDKNIISARSVAFAPYLAFKLVEKLISKEAKEKLKREILQDEIKKI